MQRARLLNKFERASLVLTVDSQKMELTFIIKTFIMKGITSKALRDRDQKLKNLNPKLGIKLQKCKAGAATKVS
jgi:hypothetical protein